MPKDGWRTVAVEGQSGIPASGVEAVALNFTVVDPAYPGYIHADKDEATPNATVTYMNFLAGNIQSNSGVVAVGSDGKIQVQVMDTTVNLILDVQGYYTAGDPAAGGYVPITPTRIVDTRNGTGLPQAKLAAGSTSTVQVSGLGGVPNGASAVMANITIVDQSTASDYTTYPADQARPLTTMHFNATTDSESAHVGLSTSGTPIGAFKFWNQAIPVDLVVDIVGYFTASSTTGVFTPAATRVLDTRLSGNTPLAAGETRVVRVGGVAGVPLAGAGISAIVSNISVIDNTTSSSRITVWADGIAEPSSPNTVRYLPGITSDMIATALGSDGAIELHNYGNVAVDVVVNIEGWYSETGSAITSGQHQTQQSITLQAGFTGAGTWMTYKYRIGTTATFVNVPTSDVTASNGSHPSWPVQASNNAFPADIWNIRNTLIAATGSAPDSLIQVQACYGSSSTDTNLACGMPFDIQFTQSAFGDGYATQNVGPGSLALLTGDYEVAATDAAAASSLAGLSVGRSLTTLAPADAGVSPAKQRSDASGVFGPGWTADLASPDAGDADLKVTDQSSAGYLLFTGTDGAVDTYQATTSLSTYPISFAPTGDATGNGEVVSKTDATHITMTDADGTVTTWKQTNATSWPVQTVTEPGSNSTTSYTYDGSGRVTRILAPVPNGISCSSGPDTTPGCRSLLLTYQTLTVSGTTVTRLQTVTLSVPQTSGTTNKIDIAAYDYTAGGLLADAYDPRISPALKTAYTYNAAGRLATLTPPGQAAWSFGYDSTGRLTTISRPDPSGTTATTSVVYGLPLTGSGLPDLRAATAGAWAETSDLPVTGTAIFPATHQPAGTTVATVATTDWPYASIDYLDVNGRQVNTAGYGAGDWQIDTSQYDSNGNDVWDLSAGNRSQALNPAGDTDPYVAALTSNVDRANALAATTIYNPLDPSEVTDTYGPTHPVTLHDGTVIDAQTHVSTSYDENAPNSDMDPAGYPYGLETTVTTDAYNVATQIDTSYPDAQITHYGYVAINGGDVDGWTLGEPTTMTTQMGGAPSSADLVSTTRYDANGRVVETRLPADQGGGTAQSTLTSYYTATGTGTCVSAVWAGLVCSTAPAAQPSTGNPLPVTAYRYDQYGNATSKIETYGTGSSQVMRTTGTGYDTAGREVSSSISVDPASAGGTALPAVKYGYDSATGLPTTTSTGSAPDTVTTLTTGYNNLGQPASYTDATGNVTTTSYDLDGRVSSVDDGKGIASYSYDSSSEHRGLITSEDIGVAGALSTFTASYDPAGDLATETYPNGLVATRSSDNAGEPTGLTYAKAGTTWMNFTQAFNPLGQIATQSSPKSSQTFSYDAADRLTTVADTVTGSGCSTRVYGFDADSNRTSLNSYPAGGDGNCTTSTTPTTTTGSFDQADRPSSDTAGSYSYDALGRTTTVPAADAQGIAGHTGDTGNLSIGYYANDMVASQTQGTATLTFTLDPDQNRIASQSDGTTATVEHYGGDTDSPAWTSTSNTAWTRNLAGIDGNLAATTDQNGTVTLELANPHGDTVATVADDPGATGVQSYSESTEYGEPRDASTAFGTYGWLGAKQRSSDSLGGGVLMGVRVYLPAVGRFTAADSLALTPMASAYDYANQNPVNRRDLSGRSAAVIKCTGKLNQIHQSSSALKKGQMAVDVKATMTCKDAATNRPVRVPYIQIVVSLYAGSFEADWNFGSKANASYDKVVAYSTGCISGRWSAHATASATMPPGFTPGVLWFDLYRSDYVVCVRP